MEKQVAEQTNEKITVNIGGTLRWLCNALLQKASAVKSKVRCQASQLLSEAAHKFSNPWLAS